MMKKLRTTEMWIVVLQKNVEDIMDRENNVYGWEGAGEIGLQSKGGKHSQNTEIKILWTPAETRHAAEEIDGGKSGW